MNILTKTTQLSRLLWKQYLDENSLAVDATAGRGRDTLFLCENCRFVYGFDIQKEAIAETEERLKESGCDNYRLVCDSHIRMDEYVSEPVDLVVFNLGYLPSGDRNITTETESTCEAVRKALTMIREGGLVSITMYWGHEEGKKEREALLDMCRKLDKAHYHCVYLNMLNQPDCPPEIILITLKQVKGE